MQHATEAFQNALLTWYRKHQRALPWRTQPSLYKTVVSEFMLQQTQVKTMLPYFARWLAAFPDFPSLASAGEEVVLKQWEGLGYYSRARNLHKLAKTWVTLDPPPTDTEGWQALPGVGPYTAAAVVSMTFGTPAACVDGNVVRILARLTADSTPFRDSASAAKALRPLAEQLLSRSNPGDHNQAMMELGATVCHRQSPLCLTCPVRRFCRASRQGEPEAFPRLAAKKIEQRSVVRVWHEKAGRLLLHRAHEQAKRLANLHELPTPLHLGLDEESVTAGSTLMAVKKRGITRYAITESIYRMEALPTPEFTSSELVWVNLAQLESITLSGPHKRWIGELVGKGGPDPAR
ncbi:MAG: A/G-specific adenine glycosylase [Opitutaceae bacterium]|nr:A/G-specific adenine glycosylase [Opitutaceae bacterium]